LTDHPPSDTSTKSLPEGAQVWEGSSAIVNQGRHWSSALIWLSSGLFVSTLIWAFTARVDQTITVRGELEPASSVKEVAAPSAGVVSKIHFKDGGQVVAGQPLLDIEAKGLAARRQAIEQTLLLLDLQARSLQIIIRSEGVPERMQALPKIPPITDPQLASQLLIARNQTEQLRSRLDQIATQIQSRSQSLQLRTKIAADYQKLYQAKAIARHTYLSQQNEVQEMRSQLASLREERTRLIGEAAAQLNQVNQQLINQRSQLVDLKEVLSYRTVRAPVSGTVFDAKVSRYSVVNSSQVMLKIVPAGRLQARVEISNADVGFVRVGLPVSVGVDSFSAGEFGYIQGTVTRLGSDALESTQPGQPPRFPAVISLQQQQVEAGSQRLNLQSGMGVTANIKLRSRPAINLVTDMFTRQFEGIKRFR